jgi:hypothetical protein
MHAWFEQLIQPFKNSGVIKEYLQPIGSLLGVVLSLSAVVKLVASAWSRHRDAWTLRSRIGSDQYNRNEILRATNCFIEPDCQSVDPSGAESFRKVYSTREPSFKALDKLFSLGSSEKYTILLADSGMGKTTLLLNYYARHCRQRRPSFNLAIVSLASNTADKKIDSLTSRSETVLLLDAFDEDTLAIQDHRQRLATILEETEDFQHVLITCRTQFFERSDEIPRETGLVRIGITSPGQEREYTFLKLYLSVLSDEQVHSYLKRRFPFWRISQRNKANSISLKIPDLRMRPMLLANIQDMLNSGTPCEYSVQIYESMIKAWLIREEPRIDAVSLRKFSEDIAVEIYTKREERGSDRIPPDEAMQLASNRGIELQSWQLRGRSLLNRDAEGNLKFSHRTIMEYLFVCKFIDDPAAAPNQIWTDQMKRFWWEKITCIYCALSPEGQPQSPSRRVQGLIDQALETGDLRYLDPLSLQPLVDVSNVPRVHPDPQTLGDYCKHLADLDEMSRRWTKRTPSMPIQVVLSNPGHEKTNVPVVVDYATGLMWQSLCTHPITYSEACHLAINAADHPIAGLKGWRIPSVDEAISLLPTFVSSYDGSPSGNSVSPFHRWADSLWTTDKLRFQSASIACVLNDEKLACPQSYASLRLVRTI